VFSLRAEVSLNVLVFVMEVRCVVCEGRSKSNVLVFVMEVRCVVYEGRSKS